MPTGGGPLRELSRIELFEDPPKYPDRDIGHFSPSPRIML
jgi:hypothetical protein